MALGTLCKDPHPQAPVGWMEQAFVVCNPRTAAREIEAPQRHLARAEKALARLARCLGSDLALPAAPGDAPLGPRASADFLQVSVEDQVTYKERLTGRRREGPNHQRRMVERHCLILRVAQQTTAIPQAERLAGWRLYVSDTSPERISVAQSIDHFRGQWQSERGFHRWQRGELPVYLKHEARIGDFDAAEHRIAGVDLGGVCRAP